MSADGGAGESGPVPVYPDLRGKVAVVTGGTQGIGLASCRALVANGCRVAVLARSATAVEDVAAELRAMGGESLGIAADARDAAQLAAACAEVEDGLGRVDIVLAYAGGFGAFTPVQDITPGEWHDVIDANLTSTLLTIQAFLPGMIERRGGSIVTMSSISGRFLDKLVTASYAAAKAGVLMLTRHAALELGVHGIRVNAIAPGTTRSERIDRIMSAEAKAVTAAMSPLGRLGDPEDCAGASLFLASDASSWITGATIDVSGGRVML